MYLAFNNSYLIQILFNSNVLYNHRQILERSTWEKFVISKLSQSESRRPFVVQKSTKNPQTMYHVFNNSYLIQMMLKSNSLSNFGNLYKISTWKKYNFLELKFWLG